MPRDWKKGESGNPIGTVKGLHSKRAFRLYDLLNNEGFEFASEAIKAFKALPDGKKWEELKCLLPYIVPTLVPADPEPASTPEDSRKSAEATLKLMRELENSAINPRAEGSDA
jgi:hypothetical protein